MNNETLILSLRKGPIAYLKDGGVPVYQGPSAIELTAAQALENQEEALIRLTSELANALTKIQDLEKKVERLNTIATDRRYMMNAYRAMLGPKGLEVVTRWEKKGVLRQHTDWTSKALRDMTGEERAQSIMDWEDAPSREVLPGEIDGDMRQFDVSTPEGMKEALDSVKKDTP